MTALIKLHGREIRNGMEEKKKSFNEYFVITKVNKRKQDIKTLSHVQRSCGGSGAQVLWGVPVRIGTV